MMAGVVVLLAIFASVWLACWLAGRVLDFFGIDVNDERY